MGEIKICPYCKCIILPNGYCRNKKCILGNRNAITIPQMDKIEELCKELETEVPELNSMTKDEASKLIDRLIKQKVEKALIGDN